MKKNRTIGKTRVLEAAAARGLIVRRVETAEGRRWEVSNGKGLRAFYATLVEVWMVVRPAPLRVAEAAPVKLPSEAVADGDLPSPSLSLAPLREAEAAGRGTEIEEEGV